eukprot:Gregarina_sp_Poly_1__4793@NODE_2554_length_1989_cov_37_433403_g1622_i0_p2_GENE_NODE_2554_length_1989_cov_37_433403_g1622_i0NODE_2554_length_1989_cov_37_433403_g1622_i0_p2_ORF_typecomplete_len244_score30_91Hepcidin/PF06446_12/43Hepcidin/PF06446_12/44_NODE_2554_length_1989_cov_37_433403_g1622_i011191850
MLFCCRAGKLRWCGTCPKGFSQTLFFVRQLSASVVPRQVSDLPDAFHGVGSNPVEEQRVAADNCRLKNRTSAFVMQLRCLKTIHPVHRLSRIAPGILRERFTAVCRRSQFWNSQLPAFSLLSQKSFSKTSPRAAVNPKSSEQRRRPTHIEDVKFCLFVCSLGFGLYIVLEVLPKMRDLKGDDLITQGFSRLARNPKFKETVSRDIQQFITEQGPALRQRLIEELLGHESVKEFATNWAVQRSK